MIFTKNNAYLDVYAIQCGIINFEYCAKITAEIKDDDTNEDQIKFTATFGESGEWVNVDLFDSDSIDEILESKEIKSMLIKMIDSYRNINSQWFEVNL